MQTIEHPLATAAEQQRPSLLAKFAGRFGVDAKKFHETLKATAFKAPKEGPPITDEQMIALVVVADQYGLNPFTKEIYAFPDRQNGIVPVVGVDGWSRIINEHRQFDGVEFVDGPTDRPGGIPEWIECVIYRKDRNHPTRVREYLSECRRPGVKPWESHPRRMLRHKALIQCARVAFGFAGIYDQDEAERIIQGGDYIRPVASTSGVDDINAQIRIAAPAPEAPAPADADSMTYAQVRDRIDKARDLDTLDIAGDFIGAVPDAQQRSELAAILDERRAALSK